MAVLTFSHQYRPKERHLTNPGSGEKILYTAEYDSKGRLVLRESGKEDLYGYIQSHRDSVDIHVLLKRYQNGELDVMERTQGFYADVSDIPDTFAGILNVVRKGEEVFAKLPAEERSRYNNSFSEWLANFDDRLRSFASGDAGDVDPQSDPEPTEKEGAAE